MTRNADAPNGPSRRTPRVHHEVMVEVDFGGAAFSGWGTNLSTGGVFVNSPSAPPVGSLVTVLLQLPGTCECKLRGRVAWARPSEPGVDEPGMGIEFLDPDDPTRALVGAMVDKLRHDLQRQPA